MTDNALDRMPVYEIESLDRELLVELQAPGAMEKLGPAAMQSKAQLRAGLSHELIRRSGIDPAGDSNDRMRSNDYVIPEPPVDPAPALPSLQHIQELKDSVAGLDDTSPRFCAVMARVKLDTSALEAAAKETQNG